MSIAAHVASWEQRGGWSSTPATFGPGEITHPTVELLLAEQWVDITPYVYYRDMITITRGRSAEASQTDPGTCRLTLNDRDGRFSPRNPVGPYYGQIGRNTPLRVSIVRNGIRRYRFYGEVSTWPVKWDISGSDAWVEVEASGILRRLSQGESPLHSALRREMTNPARTHIVAYWPCEDPDGSSVLASAFSGHSAMTISGTPTLATYSEWAGSAPLPTLGTAAFSVAVPGYAITGETSVRCFVNVPAAGVSTTQTLLDFSTLGLVRRWTVFVNSAGSLALRAYSVAGTAVLDTGFLAYAVNGKKFSLVLELSDSGSDTDYRLLTENYTSTELTTDSVSVTAFSGTLAAYSFYTITGIRIGVDGGLGDVSVGHVVIADALTAYSGTSYAIVGWRGGETGTARALRLCREDGISFQDLSHGTTGDTVTLGTQGIASLPTLLQECVDTDLGALVEPRDEIGLGFRPRTSLYNQTAVLTLDYTQNELSQSLNPVDDDRYTRNDVTVSRSGGSSYSLVQETGTLSVQAPPDGVGRYDTLVTISLGEDSLLPDQAGWRLHLGTTDEARYPQIGINLRHSTFTGSAGMMAAALVLDMGDRIVVSNPPAWLPPDDITQIVEGYTETLGVLEHDIVFACSPESPYHVAELDDSTARLDTAGSELTTIVTLGATSIPVTTTSGPEWVNTADYAAEFPFSIKAGGEEMSVTAITYAVQDAFGRTVSSGWGTADVGGSWTTTGGSASDFSVGGGVGVHSAGTRNVFRFSTVPASAADVDVQVEFSTGDVAAGDALYAFLMARYTDGNNFYFARMQMTTTQTMLLSLRKRTTAGGEVLLTSVTTEMTHAASTYYTMRLKADGSSLYAKAWPTASAEPDGWHLTTTDTDITTTGSVGVRTLVPTANTTALPVIFNFDNFADRDHQLFTVTRSVNGVTKAHVAGTAVALANPVVITL